VTAKIQIVAKKKLASVVKILVVASNDKRG